MSDKERIITVLQLVPSAAKFNLNVILKVGSIDCAIDCTFICVDCPISADHPNCIRGPISTSSVKSFQEKHPELFI